MRPIESTCGFVSRVARYKFVIDYIIFTVCFGQIRSTHIIHTMGRFLSKHSARSWANIVVRLKYCQARAAIGVKSLAAVYPAPLDTHTRAWTEIYSRRRSCEYRKCDLSPPRLIAPTNKPSVEYALISYKVDNTKYCEI
jgi:hypothetical protein